MTQSLTTRTEDGNICILYYETELNTFDTEMTGEKVYDRVLYAKIIPPGGMNQEHVFEVKRIFGNKDRPPRIRTERTHKTMNQISHIVDQFEKGIESGMVISGTPIEDVSFVHPSIIGLLKLRNIPTVEILADVPDSSLSALGFDGRSLREKARYYLQQQKESAPGLAMAAQKEALEKKINDLEKLVHDQVKFIETLTTAPPEPAAPKKPVQAKKEAA